VETLETGQPKAVRLVADGLAAPVPDGVSAGFPEEQEVAYEEYDEPQQDLEKVVSDIFFQNDLA
jgi:hypothetical protein